MPMGIDIGASADTLATTERTGGAVGPVPEQGRVEIRWCRLDARDVVVKAGGGELRDRLRREGEVLRRIGGAPVVELAELAEGADHTELVTSKFGSLTLAESGLLDPGECGAALVALCDAMEELHDLGWTHGALEASHVAVDPGSGVRLCSLADACEADSPEGRTALATDRDALAVLVADILERPPGFDSRRVRRRWSRAARKALPRLVAARGLRSAAQIHGILADVGLPGSRDSPPGHQPADSPPEEPPADDASTRGPTSPERARVPNRTKVLVAAGALAAASAAAAWSLGAGPEEVDTSAACTDVDGDDSCDEVTVEGQNVLVDGRRFEVGRPGDLARLGDWNCDGRATVALLRPSTGQLYAFDGWAENEGEEVAADFLGTFEGAASIADQVRCGPVELRADDGTLIPTSSQSDPGEGD